MSEAGPGRAGDPPGQVTTEIPGAGNGGPRTVISAGREVEQGARSMLLLAEGLFRFDVIPYEDTVKTTLRNLSGEAAAEMRYTPVGGESQVLAAAHELIAPATTRFGGEVVLVAADGSERPVAKILIGSVCDLDRGLTTFTAQATLLCPGASPA